MTWKISSVLLFLLIASCKKDIPTELDFVTENYLIEADELKTLMVQPNIKLLDFRKEEIYKKGHIKGALNIWRSDIEDSSYPYSGMMASKSQLEALFGKLGIKTEDTLIVYDDAGLSNAARLWWLLQNYDFKNVKMLHGGISSFILDGGQISNEVVKSKETVFKFNEAPKMRYYVTKEEVQESLINNTVLLDTRTEDEFSGKIKKNGAAQGGRIPKSIHIDWAEAINYNGDMRIKPLEELELIYSKLNVKKNDPIIVYCHSGVRSAFTTFVLTQLLDYKNVKNYDGSWTEWSYYNDLPFENDSIILIKN